MQASTVGTSTAGYCGTVFIAIELSQKTWLVPLHSPERGRFRAISWKGAITPDCWR